MKYANQGSKVSKMFSPNIWNKAMTNIEEAYETCILFDSPQSSSSMSC